MWELWVSKERQKKATAKAKIVDETSKRQLENMIDETIKKALQARPLDPASSKAELIRGIRQNRTEERDKERQAQKAMPAPSSKTRADVTYLHDKPEDGSFPDFLEDLFGDDE